MVLVLLGEGADLHQVQSWIGTVEQHGNANIAGYDGVKSVHKTPVRGFLPVLAENAVNLILE